MTYNNIIFVLALETILIDLPQLIDDKSCNAYLLNEFIYNNNTPKPVHVGTYVKQSPALQDSRFLILSNMSMCSSIKQSPVLNGHIFFLSCHLKFLIN